MHGTQVTGQMQSPSHEETEQATKVEQPESVKLAQTNSIVTDGKNDQIQSQNGDEDGEEDDEADADHDSITGSQLLLGPKKKKKKRKPKSKRGLNAPTGFEEYYVDTPLTPDEHAEEQELYRKDLPFIDRIFTAILCFEQTRRLTSDRRDVFLKYLTYGSINTGPRMFQSIDPKEAKQGGISKEDLAALRTQIAVTAELRDLGSPTSLYTVDFVGCVAGFLSRRAQECLPIGTREEVELITTTIERFMNYLLQHDVCPEYNTAVLAARGIARSATAELWSISESLRWLPGDFNKACSTLFNGQYARNYDGVHNWGTEAGKSTFVGFTQETANQIMSFGIAGAATESVYQDFMRRVKDDSIKVSDLREQVGFEIVEINPPTEECKELYREQSSEFRPVGRVTAKPWTNPDALPEDLTVAERTALASSLNPSSLQRHERFTFLIEEVVQRHLFVGMKLEATVYRLNCGTTSLHGGDDTLWFFDEVMRAFPSFDVFICNELMVGWKKPRPIPGALGLRHFPNMGVEEYLAELEAEADDRVDGAEKDVGNGAGEPPGEASGTAGAEAEFEL